MTTGLPTCQPLARVDFVSRPMPPGTSAETCGCRLTYIRFWRSVDLTGNQTDALVDGITCDYKRIASASLKKAVREVTGKLERQGPEFVLDLTASKIGTDEARTRTAMLLDDQKIEAIHIVTGNGSIETIKK